MIYGGSRERETLLGDIQGKVPWFVMSAVLRAYLSLRLVSRPTE
jgi:hypothetical protein